MKNLILHSFASINCSEFDLNNVELFCIDPQTGDVFIYKHGAVYVHYNGQPNLELYFNLKEYFEESFRSIQLPVAIGICYNSLYETLCIAFSHGDILTIDKLKDVQCVGSVQSGLSAIEWSYDQEVIAMVTGENTVIVMSAYFDPIKEVNLTDIGFGEKQFVTVGWGKKETQFHGSEGKSAALAKSQITDKSMLASLVLEIPKDDGKPRVSWRGDGTLFAVSVLECNGERCIRVFSRDGILQYTSEVVGGLEASFAWRPSGNLIAGTQRLPNKHQVAFFEKNGLRHGEFTLPFAHDEIEVRQLSWNGNSTILAILVERRSTCTSLIQLWTQSNYHWHLKQSLDFNIENKPVAVSWHDNRLDVIDVKGVYSQFEWAWATHRSRGQTANDGAFVAVVDGAKLLISSYRAAVPPPPMCTWAATLPHSINSVAFPPDDSNRVCVFLSDGSVAFIDASCQQVLQIKKLKWNGVLPENEANVLFHWLWTSPRQLLCCCTNKTNSTILSIDVSDLDMEEAVITNSASVGGSIISLISNNKKVIVQLSDGQLLQFSPETHLLDAFSSLPEPCIQIELTDDDSIIALSARNRLYLGKQEIANNVTSFLLRPPFILITTLQHRLMCIKLLELQSGVYSNQQVQVSVPDKMYNQIRNSDIDGYFPNGTHGTSASFGVSKEKSSSLLNSTANSGRRIERGARLVTIVPDETCVVLQMPRGNLETIQPRALCLNVAASYLDNREYYRSFDLFRKQRINLNLLCDHHLETFLDNTSHFVDQIKDPSWLSLFFTELREDDLTLTTYGEHYNKPENKEAKPEVHKVQRVCREVRKEMVRRDDGERYLQPIIASYVREGCTDEALKIAASNANALTFLSCMVDMDKLFDTALGLYDLELTALVAARTQKDPKEYLPFLNKIRKLEPNYQRYVIDEHLKRYDLALGHIVHCQGDEHLAESLALVKKHSLFKQALKLYPRESQGYQSIALAYAEHLTTKLRHLEAAILFRRAGNDARALTAFLLAGDWREALSTAWKLGYESAQVEEMCRRRLVPSLVNAGRHSEAAQIFKEVLNDEEESIATLVQGRIWEAALWATQHAKRMDLIETLVRPGIEEHLQLLKDQLASTSETFHHHKARLAVVRANQLLPPIQDPLEDHPHDDSDLFSDRSSVATRSHATSSGRSSTRSSKNRRKQERKLASLKEGGAFEDLALIRALHELVTSTCKMQDEIQGLCRILLHFNCDEDAATLQEAFSQIMQDMESSKAEIWTPELASCPEMTFGPDATTDSIISSLKSSSHLAPNVSVSSSLLDPHLRIAPILSNCTTWQMEML